MKLKDYLVKGKDPVIEIARQCVKIYAALNRISFARALRELSKESGVSAGCMQAWFYKDTISPRFCSVALVVYATGNKIYVGDRSLMQKKRAPHLRWWRFSNARVRDVG